MRFKNIVRATALAITVMSATNCMEVKIEEGYIGKSDIKVVEGHMTPEVLLSLGRLSDPQLSPDGNTVVYGVSYTSLEENRSCRNLFVCKPDGSESKPLTAFGKSVSNARWSTDGRFIYFIREGQIRKAVFNRGKLGPDSAITDIKAGVSEFKLSPDNSKIMIVSTVKGPVQTPADADAKYAKANAYSTEDLAYRHWDHWVTEIPHTFVAELGSKTITDADLTDILGGEPFELPIEPFSGVEQLSWSPDGRYIAYSCKRLTGKQYAFSTNTCIYLYNVADSTTFAVTTEGGYDTDPSFSPDGTKLIWLSMERDGYEADKTRMFVADVDLSAEVPAVSDVRELTADFKYNVDSPVWDEDSHLIYFSALTEGIKALYTIDTEANICRLTHEDWWFDFSSPWAVKKHEGDSTRILTTYCSLDFPTEMVAVNLPATEGESDFVQLSHENAHIIGQLTPVKTEQRFVKTVDGKDMLTWVMYPPKFDPDTTYPSIMIALGGPQGTLSQGWSYRWNYRLMASQGYVVVMPNRRGTTAFGQEWTEQISGDYVGLNMQDYLCAARELKAEPYIDKMAACGASYGGFSVYYLAGIHGDVFDCFIAHAGIFDEKYMYYETEEMWFPNWDNGGLGEGPEFGGIRQGGSPWSDLPKAKRHYANSPDVNIRNWHTPILCIHGGKDYRIPYDQGMAAFNCAQMMGVPSKLIVFPDENHWILKPQNALYWHDNYFGWLDRWLK